MARDSTQRSALAGSYSNWFVRARLKTRQLLLLVGLDEERNLHRAAEALGMTQPGASKLLRELEDMLGVSLFDRLPRGVQPTWYGEIMIRHARMVLATLSRAHDEITALKSGLTGQVNVGAIMGPSTTLLPRTIIAMKQRFPRVQLNVSIESSDVLQQRLQQGSLDLLVARLFETHDKRSLNYEELSHEPVALVARPGHPLHSAAGLTLRDLASASWILPFSGSVLRHRFDMMCRQAGLEPPIDVVETASLPVVTSLVQQTDQVALVPTEIALHYAQHGMLAVLPIALACDMDAFGIVTRRDTPLPPAVESFLALLREQASALYGLALPGAGSALPGSAAP